MSVESSQAVTISLLHSGGENLGQNSDGHQSGQTSQITLVSSSRPEENRTTRSPVDKMDFIAHRDDIYKITKKISDNF